MNKLIVLCLIFGLGSLPNSTAEAAIMYKVVVVGAKILPTKSDGRCWDFCFGRQKKKVIELSKQLVSLGPKGWAIAAAAGSLAAIGKGSMLPDPYVVINFSNGQKIQTHPMKNTINPNWGTTESMALSHEDDVQIYVKDKDLRDDDTIGFRSFAKIPRWLLTKGGTWKVRVQRALEVELLIVKANMNKQSRLTPGQYSFAIRSATIARRKFSGKFWDAFRGKPDPKVYFRVGRHEGLTPVEKDTYNPTWNYKRNLYITGRETILLYIADKDFRRDDLIGKCLLQVNKLKLNKRLIVQVDCGQAKRLTLHFQKLR